MACQDLIIVIIINMRWCYTSSESLLTLWRITVWYSLVQYKIDSLQNRTQHVLSVRIACGMTRHRFDYCHKSK